MQRNPLWIEREDAGEKAFPRSRLDKIKKKRNFFCFVFLEEEEKQKILSIGI